jgi:hypothetical protein
MKIFAATVATHNEGYYDDLIESCRRNKIELIVLGYGKKWQGFAWKFSLMKDFVDNLKDDSDIVIFLDAYDIIATQDISVIKERFLEFGSPLVFSSETVYKDYNQLQIYARKKMFGYCAKAHVNSGAYMGYVYALKQLFSYICKKFDCADPKFSQLDDQMIFTSICNDDDFVDRYIKFDYRFYIFYTIPLPSNIFNLINNVFEPNENLHEIKDGKLYLKPFNISPCFIHGNGNVNMDFLIDLYKLSRIKHERRFFLVKRTKYILQFFILEISILICFIVLVGVLIFYLQKKRMLS